LIRRIAEPTDALEREHLTDTEEMLAKNSAMSYLRREAKLSDLKKIATRLICELKVPTWR
jgi:hypothetical protein